ncbi:putative ester cyclase [Pararhizobium capsulatum DSM 1112]|uniref:Ester cyclase n=1 Tax=Pararhizobium capsulatum DSM 1112 TaxID=1121113 RepID=A0ABU0BNB2_9HYPH|nr:ester cyclase [Pararhizobium capsulatum]MDQ0319739.1 putative ester cyclase [Pararhizobium capsulatum DSM 1112]
MLKEELSTLYRAYIDCLNRQEWASLDQFVHADVSHNGRSIGLSGYRSMLEKDFDEIPDLHFYIELLIVDPPSIASRLLFDCTPRGNFLDLPVSGRKVSFAENVFYGFQEGRIRRVSSIIDKAAIEAQISGT